MSRQAYERMYGKPADLDKVWEDRDELHRLTDGDPSYVANQARQVSGVIKEQRRRRPRVMVLGALLAVWYLMYRMVS